MIGWSFRSETKATGYHLLLDHTRRRSRSRPVTLNTFLDDYRHHDESSNGIGPPPADQGI
jgi:hypothetical protein